MIKEAEIEDKRIDYQISCKYYIDERSSASHLRPSLSLLSGQGLNFLAQVDVTVRKFVILWTYNISVPVYKCMSFCVDANFRTLANNVSKGTILE